MKKKQMSKKQTAVEWLVEQLEYRLESLPEHNLFDQAIEKEKEQITDAFKEGIAYWNGDEWKLIDIEGYYDNLYNNNEQ